MKKFTRNALLLVVGFAFYNPNAFAQASLYDLNTIQKIEIFFSQPNWDYMMDTAKHGADGYIHADWVKVNGVHFDTVGVKYKGSSSYDSTRLKNPLHIELDHFKSQSYQGVKDIKLSNGYADPSMIREVLSYHVLGHYMIASKSNFAQVYINDSYIGLYTNTENVGKSFCSKNFNISGNTFIKCNPASNPGPMVKSNLKYISGADSTAYFGFYEMKSGFGWNELMDLCNTVTNDQSSIESKMNMDRVLWMLAFNSLLVNLDSYTGVFAQNYYLYKDVNQRFNPIVWDLNMSFGGFPFIGSGNTVMGGLTIAQMKQLTPTAHATDPYWPLINIVMNNPVYRKKYFAHLRTMASEMFASSYYLAIAENLRQLIDTAVQSDANKFFSYEHFQNALTTDYPVLSYQVPGIANLMTARLSYLQTNAEYAAVPPTILSVTGTENPVFNTELSIQANVQNATAVFLAYRLNPTADFTIVSMNAKQTSGNETAYSASFLVNSLHANYYVFALNDVAASFSPPRAEHEFYSVDIEITTPEPGELVINEFLAKNTSGVQNEYGDYADWIELKNTTNEPLSLFGLFLSDDAGNLLKFAFPENSTIGAGAYLVIFADEMPSTEEFIHCNFKLSADGEAIYLSAAGGQIIDSITFGVQSSDVSMGRCPDQTGNFIFLIEPSFGSVNNCPPQTLEVITLWDFNNETLIPSTGIGTAINIGNNTSGFGNGVTGGADRAWNTLDYPSQATNSGTAGVEFRINTMGYQNIHLSYFHRNSGTASRYVSLKYTLDGNTWSEYDLYTNGPPHDVFNQYTFDFTAIAGANNNPNFGIRIVSVFSPEPFTDPQEPFSSWSANQAYRASRNDRNYLTTGTWRFDDVTFSGNLLSTVPEIITANPYTLNANRQNLSIATQSDEEIFLQVFNLMGQPVLTNRLWGQTRYHLYHQLPPAIYIVKLTGSEYSRSQKILLY